MESSKQTATSLCQTFREQLSSRVRSIEELLRQFLIGHAILEHVSPDRGNVFFINMKGDHVYRRCDVEGRRLLGKIRIEFGRVTELMDVVLRGHGPDIVTSYVEGRKNIEAILEYQWSHSKSCEQEAERAKSNFNKMLDVFESLPDESDGIPLIIPDTNVLLEVAAFDRLQFREFSNFCILLTPTVLSEIDRLKNGHRHDSVREKAHGLVRQLKEFRRRGSLLGGVKLTNKGPLIRLIACEPVFDHTLSWLDPSVPDDRIICSVIEAIRLHPRTPVYAASHDINFQNKAEYAGVPFTEPVR